MGGGGIEINAGSGTNTDLKLERVLIVANTTPFQEGADGGGLIVHSFSSSMTNVSIQRSVISENQAQFGGGIFSAALDKATVNMTLNNNIIHSNKAARGGGGVFSGSGHAQEDKPGGTVNWTLTNNTITGNIAENGSGFGSNTAEGGSTSISSHNDIIWGNKNFGEYSGEVSLADVGGTARAVTFRAAYSNISSVGAFQSASTEMDNVISQDPMFVDTAKGVFYLRDGSPCIDSGDPNSSLNDGLRLPAKGTERNDVGAYGGPKDFDWLIQENS